MYCLHVPYFSVYLGLVLDILILGMSLGILFFYLCVRFSSYVSLIIYACVSFSISVCMYVRVFYAKQSPRRSQKKHWAVARFNCSLSLAALLPKMTIPSKAEQQLVQFHFFHCCPVIIRRRRRWCAPLSVWPEKNCQMSIKVAQKS